MAAQAEIDGRRTSAPRRLEEDILSHRAHAPRGGNSACPAVSLPGASILNTFFELREKTKAGGVIYQAAASREGSFSVLPNRAAGRRLRRRRQRSAGSRVKSSRWCWAGASSPAKTRCSLLLLGESASFFPPQGAASLLAVGRRPTGRTSSSSG